MAGKIAKTDDRLQARCFAALHRVATAVIGQRGRLLGDNALAQRTGRYIRYATILAARSSVRPSCRSFKKPSRVKVIDFCRGRKSRSS